MERSEIREPTRDRTPDFASLIRATIWIVRSDDKDESKGGPKARRFAAPCSGCPGGVELHPGFEKLLLLGFLGLLRLLRLLRFLSHSILSGFNGWKRDTRGMLGGGPASQHPRNVIQQIREALPRAVTALSLRYPQLLCVFDGFLAAKPRTAADRRRRARLVRVNDAPTRPVDRIVADRFPRSSRFQNHSTDWPGAVRVR
jgi:hypothetical protein